MDLYLNGKVFLSGTEITTDMLDITQLSKGVDYLVVIGVCIVILLLIDLARRIMSGAMRIK